MAAKCAIIFLMFENLHSFFCYDRKWKLKFADQYWGKYFFLKIKPTRCTNFSCLFFGMKLYKFRTVPLSIIRSFSLCTQQWFMSYRFADIYHCWVYKWKTPYDGQRNCPKHAEFHSKIKFWEISAPSWFYYKKYVQEYDIKICEHPLLSGILLNTHRELPYWCCLHVQFVFRFYKLCYFTENKSNSPVEPVDVLNVIE